MSSIIKRAVISVVAISVIKYLESIFGELPLVLKFIMYFVPLCLMIDAARSNYQARRANGLRPEDRRELEAMSRLARLIERDLKKIKGEERKESQFSLEDEEYMQEGDVDY